MKSCLMIILSLCLVACSQDEAPAAGGGQMPPATVRTGEPEPGTMEEILTIAGSLQANRSALISAEIAGIVDTVNVADGQAVAQGDLLFTIHSASLQAELQRADANVQLRREEQKRVQSLFKRNVASQYDVDKANAELLTAEADRDFARAELAKASLRAPFAGTLGIRRVSEGSYVQPGDALIPLVELDPLLLDFSAPETVLAMIGVDTVMEVQIPALQRTVQAVISAIEPVVSETTRSVRIRARVANTDGVLRPGLFARVSLPVKVVSDVLWLPESALFYQGDDKLVMVSDDGKALRKKVDVAGFRDGRVAIRAGLDAGDVVVISGHHKLPFDGMPLMPVDVAPGDVAKPAAGQAD